MTLSLPLTLLPQGGLRMRWWWSLLTAWVLCLALGAAPAYASGIDLKDTKLMLVDGAWNAQISADIDLSPAVEEAVNKGIVLYFVTDYELYRSRWYWFDEKVLSSQYFVRLSYQPLTRQYYVAPRNSMGGLQQRFSNLREALGMVRRISSWRIADRNTLRVGDSYQAAVRMRLDISQLPKPFQVNAVNSQDWNLTSDWRRFNLTATDSGR